MTQTIKPYSRKEALDRIEMVISGIEKGELNHKQSSLHCRTAHCIAGWLQVFDYRDGRGNKQFTHDELRLNDMARDWGVGGSFSLDYVRKRYRLSYEEADDLFDRRLSIEEIRKNFEKMKKKAKWSEHV